MSQALIQAGRLKADIRLAQAVSEFVADLSAEQKARFQAYRTQSISSPPDHDDVMRLTAEIDRCAYANGNRRCVSARTVSFLSAIQQFAALGDVIIGGSQNLIACAVWSLSVVQYSSFIEKVSGLLMIVGHSAPRYQQLALLYPRSKSLQSNLLEYYIVVVTLCHKLLKFTQKSTFKQLASVVIDSEVKTYQSNLDRWATAIQNDVNFLMAKRLEEEALENSSSRFFLSKLSQEEPKRRKLKNKFRVLDACSTYDYETTWKQIRKAGRATFFSSNPSYTDWKLQTDSSTLVYTGKLGAGKSVLLANIVDDLFLQAKAQNALVCYFFCRHDISESLKSHTVLGSFARQLLRHAPDLSFLEDFDLSSICLDSQSVLQILKKLFPSNKKAYFVLDGLDECEPAERDELLQHLHYLGKTSMSSLLICISSRLEPDSSSKIRPDQVLDPTYTSIPELNPDIETFIETELEHFIESGKLVVRDLSIIPRIQEALVSGAQGMFLWVVLQITSLSFMKSDYDIRQALADLPKDLPETFYRILARSKAPGYQETVLQLSTAALRPLTVEELREAMSVVPGEINWDRSRLPNDMFEVLCHCGGLVIIDEEELTVRLVHHSVKQYLLDVRFQPAISELVSMERAESRLADTVVTYLNYKCFDTQLSRSGPKMPTASIPDAVIDSTKDYSSHFRALAVRLLKSRKAPDLDISRIITETGQFLTKSPAESPFPFLAYAASHWEGHCISVSNSHPMLRLLKKLVREKFADPTLKIEEHQRLLSEVTTKGRDTVGDVLIGTISYSIDLSKASNIAFLSAMITASLTGNVHPDNQTGEDDLMAATRAGRLVIVRLLIEKFKINVNVRNIVTLTPLMIAAHYGNSEIAKFLLNTQAIDVNLQDQSGRTSLIIAIKNRDRGVSEELLAAEAIDVNKADKDDLTPLMWALIIGEMEVLEHLLGRDDINVNARDKLGKSLLGQAIEKNEMSLAEELLRRHDIDMSLSGLGPSVDLAIELGYEDFVNALVNRSQAPNESDTKTGGTFLCRAVQTKNLRAVQYLMDIETASVNTKDNYGLTPLCHAVVNEDVEMAAFLLKAKDIDANLAWDTDPSLDPQGGTPLIIAVRLGYKPIVKLLLNSGKVNVDLRDKLGDTPLMCAVRNKDERVVELLLETGGADMNLENAYHHSPLSAAARLGCEGIVRHMIMTGRPDLNKGNEYSTSPFLNAVRGHHMSIASLMIQTGEISHQSRVAALTLARRHKDAIMLNWLNKAFRS